MNFALSKMTLRRHTPFDLTPLHRQIQKFARSLQRRTQSLSLVLARQIQRRRRAPFPLSALTLGRPCAIIGARNQNLESHRTTLQRPYSVGDLKSCQSQPSKNYLPPTLKPFSIAFPLELKQHYSIARLTLNTQSKWSLKWRSLASSIQKP